MSVRVCEGVTLMKANYVGEENVNGNCFCVWKDRVNKSCICYKKCVSIDSCVWM